MPDFYIMVPIKAVPKGRPRFSRKGFAYTPMKTRKFESHLRWLLVTHPDAPEKPLEGALKVRIGIGLRQPKGRGSKRKYPSVRPDLDNQIKGVKDAANGVLWKDDAQIVDLHASKFYTDMEEYIAISMEVLE